MVEEFVNPNLHIALVHFPLALLVAGTLIELFSFLYRRSGFRSAGRWMILLGALSAVPVALSGMYALMDITQTNNPQAEGYWADAVAASPLRASARAMIQTHTWIMGAATLAGLFVVVTYLASSDKWRARLYSFLMLILLGTVGASAGGAWYAGEGVYMLGAAVKSGDTKIERAEGVTFFLPPEQIHVLLAGCAFSLAAVSFAVAVRRVSGVVDMEPAATTERTDPIAMLRSLSPDTVFSRVDVPPAARFWLLAMLLAILAALAGWWLLASESSAWTTAKESHQSVYKFLWDQVRPPPDQKINRRFAHVVAGGALIVLPLLLAIFARLAPRRRGILSLLSLLMLAVIAAQVWLGSLLMFDTLDGPVTRFNAPAAKPEPAPRVVPSSIPVTLPATVFGPPPTTLPARLPSTRP